MQKLAFFAAASNCCLFWESRMSLASQHRGDTCSIKRWRLKSVGSDNLRPLTGQRRRSEKLARFFNFFIVYSFGSLGLILWIGYSIPIIQKRGAYCIKLFVYIENGEHTTLFGFFRAVFFSEVVLAMDSLHSRMMGAPFTRKWEFFPMVAGDVLARKCELSYGRWQCV